MDFEVDQSKILYGLGAFLGVISILYFGQELILDLSPMVKSIILFSSTAAFLSAGEYTKNGALRSSLYIFSAFSYLSFLTYTTFKFGFTSEETFLLLAISSAVFITLGYLKSKEKFELGKNKAKLVLVVIIAFITFTVVFDVLGAQPKYNLELNDTVEVVDGEEFQIGMLEIRNDFIFPRNVDIPTYRGCLGGQRERIYISPEIEGGMISGGSVDSLDLKDTVGTRPEENMTVTGSYTVERSECPENPEEDKMYINQDEDFRGMVRRVD